MPSFSVESFIKALQSVWYARDFDRSSPILMAVNVVVNGDYLTVDATDGKILGEWVLDSQRKPSMSEFEIQDGTNVNILINDVKVLKPFLKNMKGFSVKIETRVVNLSNNETSINLPLIEGSFPPYQQVLQRPVQNFEDFHGDAVIGINVEYFSLVEKILGLNKNYGTRCEYHGNGRGMIFRPLESFCEKRTALVMPITLPQ